MWFGFLQNDSIEMAVGILRFEQCEFPSTLSSAGEYFVLRDRRVIDRENVTHLKRAFSFFLPFVDRPPLASIPMVLIILKVKFSKA